MDVWRYHFLVSALHLGCCFYCFFCSFFMTYTARQSGCLLAGWSYFQCAEMMWYQFLLCFFFVSPPRSNTLSHCCFPFLPSSSSFLSFLSIFGTLKVHEVKNIYIISSLATKLWYVHK